MFTLVLAAAESNEREVLALLLILAVAAGVTMVLRRLKLSTIPGYVIAGALIGPHATGLVGDTESARLISEVAILLLMFTIGMHLDLNAVRVGLWQIMALGAGTTLASTVVGWGAGVLIVGHAAPVALTIAMALSMSSTAVVLRILQQRREMHSMHGRITFGVLIVQDMLALVVLAVLPPIAEWAGVRVEGLASGAERSAWGLPRLGVLAQMAIGLVGIAALIAFGNRLLPKLLREAAKDPSSETLLVLSAAVALGAAALTKVLGFSAELGAFLAGFILASTQFKYQLSGQLAPMRDLFMAVFFTTVGLQLDGRELVTNWPLLVAALPALVLGKAVVLSVGTWLSGATGPTSFITGVALAQASEFSLVVLAVAHQLKIVDDRLYGQVVALAVVSLALAPTLYVLGDRWRGYLAHLPTAKWTLNSPLRAPEARPDGTPPQRHVIVAGFGVVGRNLVEHFAAAAIPYTIVELNPATVVRQRRLGRTIIFGDIANTEVLETAGIHGAEAVILTIPDEEATLRACRAIRRLAPEVFIAARTANLSRAIAATDLGADHVTVEEVAAAQEMARQVMAQLTRRRAKAAGEGSARGTTGHAAPAAAGES